MAILEVKNIEKHFGSTKVLKDISFDLEEGQALAIIGSSGSGKTTLLRCLNFLETPTSGIISVKDKILFDTSQANMRRDKELRNKRLHFGMVFQSFNLFPQYTALENVILAEKLLAQELSLIHILSVCEHPYGNCNHDDRSIAGDSTCHCRSSFSKRCDCRSCDRNYFGYHRILCYIK